MSDLLYPADTSAKLTNQPKPEKRYVYILICTPGYYLYSNVESIRDYIKGAALTLELARSILDNENSKDGLGWQLIHNQWQFNCKDQDPEPDLDLDSEQIAQNASEYTGARYRIEQVYLLQA